MSHQIERLRNHVIVCGFGRIGDMVARELQGRRGTVRHPGAQP